MPLRSDHFITPIKLVLPGIIVSVIGLFASNYIFNNPDKNRAKATFATWKVINQFERILEKNSDLLPCNTPAGDQLLLKKDFIHLYEMTRQNMVDLKDEEKIDKRLSAILNMKIDSYTELKRITEAFLDSAQFVIAQADKGVLPITEKNYIISQMQSKYVNDLTHVVYRDTAMTKNILKELNQSYSSYVDSFVVVEKVQSYEEIQKLIPGKWITTDKVTIEIKTATINNSDPSKAKEIQKANPNTGTGHWEQSDREFDFTWTIDKSTLTMKRENGKDIVFEIVKISDALVTFVLTDAEGNAMIANACRI